jgi:hypothetical protein
VDFDWLKFDVKSITAGFLVCAVLAVVFTPGDGHDNSFESQRKVDPLPDFQPTQKTSQVDSSALLERYKKLVPQRDKKKSQEASRQAVRKPPKKVIDKTIYPFFAQYDEQHQIGLAGTFIDDKAFAVIQLINFETREATFHEVTEGASFGRFTLKTLTREEVVLVANGVEMTLTMFNKGSS